MTTPRIYTGTQLLAMDAAAVTDMGRLASLQEYSSPPDWFHAPASSHYSTAEILAALEIATMSDPMAIDRLVRDASRAALVARLEMYADYRSIAVGKAYAEQQAGVQTAMMSMGLLISLAADPVVASNRNAYPVQSMHDAVRYISTIRTAGHAAIDPDLISLYRSLKHKSNEDAGYFSPNDLGVLEHDRLARMTDYTALEREEIECQLRHRPGLKPIPTSVLSIAAFSAFISDTLADFAPDSLDTIIHGAAMRQADATPHIPICAAYACERRSPSIAQSLAVLVAVAVCEPDQCRGFGPRWIIDSLRALCCTGSNRCLPSFARGYAHAV